MQVQDPKYIFKICKTIQIYLAIAGPKNMFMLVAPIEKFKENFKLTSIKLNTIASQTADGIPASKNF